MMHGMRTDAPSAPLHSEVRRGAAGTLLGSALFSHMQQGSLCGEQPVASAGCTCHAECYAACMGAGP